MLYLTFRSLKKKRTTYILYLMNEKRVVLKKLGQLSFLVNDLSIYVLHFDMFLFFKLLQNVCFLSESFFTFLLKIKN